MTSVFHSYITGCGMSVPDQVVTNDDLSKSLDTTDTWIVERTGIRARRRAGPSDTVASLGTVASQRALEDAHVLARDIDAIILATTSPDHFMPATATKIQANLGAQQAFAFDLQAVCSGFVYALSVADQFIRSGHSKTVLVIGADLMSRMVDWTDRSTCVLFGDGAGAVVLQSTNERGAGILSTHLFSDGTAYDKLYSDVEAETPQHRGKIIMNGRSVYVRAIEVMAASVRTALEQQHLSVKDLDWMVAHQANKRIIDAVAHDLGLPEDKAICIIDSYANTSAATIPMALAVASHDGRIQKGNLIALTAMGAGFTWGSALARW